VDAGRGLKLYVNNARIYAKELLGGHNEYEMSIKSLKDDGLQVQYFFDKPEHYPVCVRA
jgi:hypothetical protein